MKLDITRNLENNDCHVSFKITDITNADIEMFKDYGVQKVDVGGLIPTDELSTFKMSSEIKIIPDTFEFTKIFKSIEHKENTEKYALAYITEIKKRVTDLITTLESKSDTFSGVESIQL